MISTEFKGKLALRSCNLGEKGDTFESYTFFPHNKSFYTLHDFIISVTPARLTRNKLAQEDYKTTTFLCVFLNKETTSYNKNIVQLIFQLGSVNSRNLSPLTELITKMTIERRKLTSVRRKICAKPYEVTEPRTSELVNLLPSNWYSECKHPFQFDKLMVITDEPAVQSARLLSLGSNCIQATSSTCSRYLCYSIDAESCSSIPKSSK